MSERAEGFWWVRCRGRWSVGEVQGINLYLPGLEWAMAIDDADFEWGPYLGTEPGACHWCARPLADHPAPLAEEDACPLRSGLVLRAEEATS